LVIRLLGRRLAHREDGSRGDRGDTESREAPLGSRQGPSGNFVGRDRAGTGHREPDRDSDDQQVELVAAVRVEEPVPPVDGRDRHEHHAGDGGRRQGGEQTENEQRAASELGEPDDHGVQASRLKAHRVEPATGTGETVATEPPEQLLGAVRRHDPSEHDSDQEKTALHLFLLLAVHPEWGALPLSQLAAASNYSPIG
jgi:hypothetical protein